ncbi:MAG TPA: type 1 glutamine amidotransferase domain-containing protein [Cyclobacteriaceae bacterium]|nr:type 1 glutamine amidotransferase domain-containing protein [Cyclobacteriaceae bacterium]
MGKLSGKSIAIVTENGFEEVELTSPKAALENEGASVHIVSPQTDQVVSWDKKDWGKSFSVDKPIKEASVNDYDAVLIPGGVINPDHLRRSEEAIQFIKSFFEQGKPVAAICHGPQVLIETGKLKGRKVTSFFSVKTDLINAGADWSDEECVVDQGLVTSRNPDDLPAFNKKIIEEILEGKHEGQKK